MSRGIQFSARGDGRGALQELLPPVAPEQFSAASLNWFSELIFAGGYAKQGNPSAEGSSRQDRFEDGDPATDDLV